jgi:hypothetical protein
MKKLALLTLIAMSLFASKPNKVENPLPTCDPCPFVR